MLKCGTQRLEKKRLILRKLNINDTENIYKN